MEETRESLEELLVVHMERLMADMRSLSPARLSSVELTMRQMRALVVLSHGPKRMSELSGNVGSGMPSATSMIDRLVKKKVVERVEDPSDRRVVTIRLTALGVEVVERFLRIGRMRYEALADALTLEELRAAVPTVELLAKAARRRKEAGVFQSEVKASEAEPAHQTVGRRL